MDLKHTQKGLRAETEALLDYILSHVHVEMLTILDVILNCAPEANNMLTQS
jgi:hypothetical protein